MAELDQMLDSNEQFAAGYDKGQLPMPPARGVAIVTCMDARIDPAKVSGSTSVTPTSSATPAAASRTTRSAR